MTVLRGTLMYPLAVPGAEGIYTDENEVNWLLHSRAQGGGLIDKVTNLVSPGRWHAWIDGDDGKAVYALSSSGDEGDPLVKDAADVTELASKIDGWIAAKGKLNPQWQATQAAVQALQSKGKGTAHGQGDLGTQHLTLWDWLLAAGAIYLISKHFDRGASGARRSRK